MAKERIVSFSGTGQGTYVSGLTGTFRGGRKFEASLDLDGGTGTFNLERYNGINWRPIYIEEVAGLDLTATRTFTVEEPTEGGALYRWTCTVHGSGAPKGILRD